MDTLDATALETVAPLISQGAMTGRSRHRHYIQYAEAISIGWVWVGEHPNKVQECLDDGKRGSRRLSWLVSRAVDKAGREERAASLGYRPEDEAFYSKGTLELILPAVFDPHYRPELGHDKSGVAHRPDPSERGEWETMVVDVRKAWDHAHISEDSEDALRLRFADGLSVDAVAKGLGVHRATAFRRISDGLTAMVNYLGGFSPACEAGCECGHASLGTRRVASNAAWRATSSSNYQD